MVPLHKRPIREEIHNKCARKEKLDHSNICTRVIVPYQEPEEVPVADTDDEVVPGHEVRIQFVLVLPELGWEGEGESAQQDQDTRVGDDEDRVIEEGVGFVEVVFEVDGGAERGVVEIEHCSCQEVLFE